MKIAINLIIGASLAVIIIAANEYIKVENRINDSDKIGALELMVQEKKPEIGLRNYTVGEHDSLESIVQTFNVSINTIKQANNLKGDTVTRGQHLMILPINGSLHIVKEGEDFNEISKRYGVDKQNIIDFPGNEPLSVGQTLIIPMSL